MGKHIEAPGAVALVSAWLVGCTVGPLPEQRLTEQRAVQLNETACPEGAKERKAPCADGRGTGTRLCVDGVWQQKTCSCAEPSEKYDRLADACLIPVDCDGDARPFGGGDGEASPYLICNRRHLENVSTAPNARFLLARSLDLRHVHGFVPLEGVREFDGGGRVLANLVIDRSSVALGAAEDRVGLFRSLYEATIRDLTLRRFTVRGGRYVGALTGHADADVLIERVVVEAGSVTGEDWAVGGLAGRVEWSAVVDSSASCTVAGESTVGGLVGFTYRNTFTRCSAHGAVSALASEVGGLFGQTNEEAVLSCTATGAVHGPDQVGGLIGRMTSDDLVRQSVAKGNVSGHTRVGGLVGRAWGYNVKIENSYALGNVTADGSELGGLVGYALHHDEGFVATSYFFGDLTWAGENTPPASIGTLFGYLGMPVLSVVGLAQSPPWPLVGELGEEGSVTDSSVLPESAFADEASFPDWDFDDVWIMSPELGRPVLRWELED